jgi:hypothetical protein
MKIQNLLDVEKQYILWAMTQSDNKSAVARDLGIDRRTLYRKLARYEAESKLEETLNQLEHSNSVLEQLHEDLDKVVSR